MRHTDRPLVTVLHTSHANGTTVCGAEPTDLSERRRLPLCSECQWYLRRSRSHRAPKRVEPQGSRPTDIMVRNTPTMTGHIPYKSWTGTAPK